MEKLSKHYLSLASCSKQRDKCYAKKIGFLLSETSAKNLLSVITPDNFTGQEVEGTRVQTRQKFCRE